MQATVAHFDPVVMAVILSLKKEGRGCWGVRAGLMRASKVKALLVIGHAVL